MKVKIAVIQTQTFLEADEQKKNIERAREYVAEAAKQGAQRSSVFLKPIRVRGKRP